MNAFLEILCNYVCCYPSLYDPSCLTPLFFTLPLSPIGTAMNTSQFVQTTLFRALLAFSNLSLVLLLVLPPNKVVQIIWLNCQLINDQYDYVRAYVSYPTTVLLAMLQLL